MQQCMNRHFRLDNMEYGQLAEGQLRAVDEMREAEMARPRQGTGRRAVHGVGVKVQEGQQDQGRAPFDAKFEDNTIDVYYQFAAVTAESGDSIS